MKRLSAAVAAALVVLVLVTTPAGAADDGLSIVSVESSEYPEVRLVVEMPDGAVGAPLGTWSITEREVARPATARLVTNESLRVVLVVDTSGSMQGASIAAAKSAARGFLDRLPAGSEVGVVGFGSRPTVLHPLSADRVSAAAALDRLVAAGETALHDAVVVAAQQVPADGRRTEIILLSDGGDTVSAATLDRAIEVLRGSSARLHSIALDTAESNRAVLESLAASGAGGVVAAAHDGAALSSVYDRLAARLVQRYEVTYQSSANGPTAIVVAAQAATGSLQGTTTLELPAARYAAPAATGTRPAERSSTLLLVGSGLVFVGSAVLLGILFVPAAPRALIAGAARRMPRRGHLADLSDRATVVAEAALHSGKAKGIAVALENAGIMLRPAEFVVTVASVALGATLLGFVLGGLLLGLVLLGLVLFGARLLVTNRIERRRKRFSNQLSDTLQQLTSALRAGHGLLQALSVVAREAEEPTSDEFRRLMTEVRLGRDLGDALHAMAARVSSEDFDWVVQAIEVQRDVGGDLVEVIEIVANTIRQRQHLQRQVKALSAEGRFSAYVLLALPFGVSALLFLTNRAYLMQLFSGRGLVLLLAGVVLMVAGTAWLKKIIQLEY